MACCPRSGPRVQVVDGAAPDSIEFCADGTMGKVMAALEHGQGQPLSGTNPAQNEKTAGSIICKMF